MTILKDLGGGESEQYTSDIYLHGVSTPNPSLQRQWLPLKQQERDIHNCP